MGHGGLRHTAKQGHIDKILKYLANWENPWPSREAMSKICGLKPAGLRVHLTPEDFGEVETTGLELRLKNAAIPRAYAYDALSEKANKGDVSAIKEILDRIEGKVKERKEVTLKAPPGLKIIFTEVDEAKPIS